MSANPAKKYLKDPLFIETMRLLQNGDWNDGLDKLNSVKEQFPGNKELDSLHQEMLIRAKIDEYEVEDRKRENQRQITKFTLRGFLAILVLFIILWGVIQSSSWIQQQWQNVRQRLASDIENVELSVTFRDAQSFLRAGRPLDAQNLLERIQSESPDYPGLQEMFDETEKVLAISSQYETAKNLIEQGSLGNALEILQMIEANSPNYLDVPLLIQEIEGQYYLNDLLTEAEASFDAENWELAASQYETIRAISPQFNNSLIEKRLIDSYVNAALELLEEQPDSLEALSIAESYFRKALVLKPQDKKILEEQTQAQSAFKDNLFDKYVEEARLVLSDKADSLGALEKANRLLDKALALKPNDAEISLERQMAKNFIQAQNDFSTGLLDQTIEELEFVYENDPNYANGTSTQTLYDAYVSRGDSLAAIGEYEAALNDFQRAAEIAEQSPKGVIKLYLAKIKIAEIYGILNDYSTAVLIYKDAVEMVNLRTFAQKSDPNLVAQLDEAERYADIEWYRTAYRLYNRNLPALDVLFAGIEITVQDGDYLTSLANQYETTVQAILNANQINGVEAVKPGQKIIIPVLPEEEK